MLSVEAALISKVTQNLPCEFWKKLNEFISFRNKTRFQQRFSLKIEYKISLLQKKINKNDF